MDYDEKPDPPNASRDRWYERCQKSDEALGILRAAAREVILADAGIDSAAGEDDDVNRYARAMGVMRKLVSPGDELHQGPMPHEVLAAAKELLDALAALKTSTSARVAIADRKLRVLLGGPW